MHATRVEDSPGRRTWVLAFRGGDQVELEILRFAEENAVQAAEIRGIGGFREVTLAYFEKKTMQYEPIPVKEQVEVVSILGNLTRFEGKPKLHAHVLIGKKDGSTLAGHLLAAAVWPTLELFVTAYAEPLERKQDPETKLPLL
jgi:predicted DNA-binding protein with PD1-like motif